MYHKSSVHSLHKQYTLWKKLSNQISSVFVNYAFKYGATSLGYTLV